ncbi:MAG: hypothetical protein CR954_00480 [Candidatus Moraniibacteriota bacterium]|nr:MAG: hypothetical protein CR954_00480 [Candidatus Moranbacteria bacterium]
MNKTLYQRACRVIFGQELGARTQKFLSHIAASFTGGLSAFALLFITNMIVARILGPEEYGRYTVFFSCAQFLALFFVLELDVSALYFLGKKSVQHIQRIHSALMHLFAINITLFSVIAVVVYYVYDFQTISLMSFVGVIVMAFSFAFKRMIDAFLRAEKKFSIQSGLRFAEAISVIASVGMIFYFLEYKSFYGYVYSIIFGGVVFCVVGGFFVRTVFVWKKWHAKTTKKIFRYTIRGVINTCVNGIVKNTDKFLIVGLLGASTVGLYAVYFTASVTIGARLTQLFINVFFPSVRSNVSNRARIYAKINTMVVRFFVPLVICASLGVAGIVFLYGHAYAFIWLWVVLCGVYIAVHFCASLYGWFLSSISTRGYTLYNISFLYGIAGYIAVIGVSSVAGIFSVPVFFVALIVYRFISGVFCFYHVRGLL